MKRAVWLSALALFLSLGQSYCSSKPDTTYYKVKLSYPSGYIGTAEMKVKGAGFIWRQDTSGVIQRFIRNQDGAFGILPNGRVAGKYPAGSNRESPMTYLPGPIGDVKAFLASEQAKKAGQEKVDKKLCDVYTYVEKQSGRACKLLVAPKTFAPVKLIVTGKSKKAQTRTAMYLAYKTGAAIPDSVFQLPKGIQIRQMPNHQATQGIGAKPGE